MGEGVGGGGVR